ncbi:hypothetical protein BOTBODRAFT_616458 [Botryobasidium botryosum FD-172 SS1]|uniref:Uncharacterized protein n=1 Tax=Botryobasidium botryosum (strain FD-172 SS1) TaxID=930990 RepID=A0A067M6A1_BOTB1|nr:hypothetical protein BOTBODRAFT_616458 [Botryobasidium botryosum FD-172 SS1]
MSDFGWSAGHLSSSSRVWSTWATISYLRVNVCVAVGKYRAWALVDTSIYASVIAGTFFQLLSPSRHCGFPESSAYFVRTRRSSHCHLFFHISHTHTRCTTLIILPPTLLYFYHPALYHFILWILRHSVSVAFLYHLFFRIASSSVLLTPIAVFFFSALSLSGHAAFYHYSYYYHYYC